MRATTTSDREFLARRRIEKLEQKLNAFTTEVVLPTLVDFINKPERQLYRKVSPVEIRELYGANCLDIFRLLFVLHQVGGRTGHGATYVTMWVARMDQMQEFANIVREGGHTPRSVLEKMKEAGYEVAERTKGPDGIKVLEGEELEQFKVLRASLRQQEREGIEYDSATYW